MALIGKTIRDSAQRGAIGVWRYTISYTAFTASATTETITVDPIVDTGQTFSGGGIIILDAWVQVSTLFVEPAAGAFTMDFGPTSAGANTLIDGAIVSASGLGALGLVGTAVAQKGNLLIPLHSAGETVWIDENDDIKITLAVAGGADVDEATAGEATLVVLYMQVPESD